MLARSLSTRSAVAAAAFLAVTATAVGQCGLRWQPTLPMDGTNARVTDLEPTANGLYACGWFRVAGGVTANHVARFDGSAWHALGNGVDNAASSIVALPNGNIVVGGFFASAGGVSSPHVASWDGSTWSALGTGLNGSVHALAVMPNGDLVAGGSFRMSGSQPMPRLARWDGSSWSTIGGGIDNGQVLALEVMPNGNLAVGGSFSGAGGTATSALAVWDGTSWASPSITAFSEVYAIESLANGDLVFGGDAQSPTDNIGIWDGQTTQYLSSPINGAVHEILSDSAGDLVVGGGVFVSGIENNVARLRGGVWTVLDNGFNKTFDLVEVQGKLIAAGGSLSEIVEPTIKEHDGSGWTPVGGPRLPSRLYDVVAAVHGGVYVSGLFETVGGVAANHVAHFDGINWHSLAAGLDDGVLAMASAPNGDLIVGGWFLNAGGSPASRVARWNGTNWSTLGAGLSSVPVDLIVARSGDVVALVEDGPMVRIFDGLAWSSLPDSSFGLIVPRSVVELPNGNLVVNGLMAGAAAIEWDGVAWTALGSFPAAGGAMIVDDNGDLLMSGNFPFGFGVGRWDGSNWNAVGTLGGHAGALLQLPDGDLIAGGPTQLIFPGVPGDVARFDGQTWSAVDGGASIGVGTATFVIRAAISNEGELYCVGNFATMGPTDVVSPRFARAVSDCPADASVFGSGCSGSAGSVSLATLDQPWLGATFDSRATGMAASSLAVHALGTVPNAVPLPGGAPGCSLFVQPDVLELLVPVSGSVDASIAIPNNPTLVGLSVRTQVIGLELGAGFALTRITSSNALELTIGAL